MNDGASLRLRARPFDFLVAFLVFFMGLYGFLDPDWPEGVGLGDIVYWIIVIEDIYLVLAGLAIMTALIIRQRSRRFSRWFVGSLVAEMFGCLFVSSASAVIVLTSPWIPPSAFAAADGPLLWIWIALWAGLALSSFLRSMDLRLLGRRKG